MKAKQTSLIFAVVLMFGSFVVATPGQARVVVKFPKGGHSATVRGKIHGYSYVDYILGARVGQTMTVGLASNNDLTQMVVFDPSGGNPELGMGVAEFKGVLELSGNYKVRILLPRSEARRRNSAAIFTATFRIE